MEGVFLLDTSDINSDNKMPHEITKQILLSNETSDVKNFLSNDTKDTLQMAIIITRSQTLMVTYNDPTGVSLHIVHLLAMMRRLYPSGEYYHPEDADIARDREKENKIITKNQEKNIFIKLSKNTIIIYKPNSDSINSYQAEKLGDLIEQISDSNNSRSAEDAILFAIGNVFNTEKQLFSNEPEWKKELNAIKISLENANYKALPIPPQYNVSFDFSSCKTPEEKEKAAKRYAAQLEAEIAEAEARKWIPKYPVSARNDFHSRITAAQNSGVTANSRCDGHGELDDGGR